MNYSHDESYFLNSLSAGGMENFLQFTFKTCVFDLIAKQCPGTGQLDEKFIEIESGGKAYLAIIEIPCGSNMIDTETGRRADFYTETSSKIDF